VSAWAVLASFLICARASAAVVEAAPAAVPTAPGAPAVGAVGASAAGAPALSLTGSLSLVPTLTPGLSLSPAAIGAALGAAPGAGAVRLAPAADVSLPASAVTGAAAAAPAADVSAPGAAPAAPQAQPGAAEALPPPAAPAELLLAPAASARQSFVGAELAAPAAAAAAAARGTSIPAAGRLEPATPEAAAASSRAFWDQSAERAELDSAAFSLPRAVSALLAQARLRPARRGASAGFFGSDGDVLRDAVAAPPLPAYARAAAAPGTEPRPLAAASVAFGALGPARWAAESAAPLYAAIERLTLSLGRGLVVRVNGELGTLSATAAAPASAPEAASGGSARAALSSSDAPRPAARPLPLPLFSTEFLERRGLLETVATIPQEPLAAAASARTEQAASRAFAAGTPAAARRARADAPASETGRSPLAWWALAFLPATLALLRDPLR
jgi:hypothetical protein